MQTTEGKIAIRCFKFWSTCLYSITTIRLTFLYSTMLMYYRANAKQTIVVPFVWLFLCVPLFDVKTDSSDNKNVLVDWHIYMRGGLSYVPVCYFPLHPFDRVPLVSVIITVTAIVCPLCMNSLTYSVSGARRFRVSLDPSVKWGFWGL